MQLELVLPMTEGIGGSETVRGEVAVSAKLGLGSQRLRLIVTNNRILVVHVGKRGSGAGATASMFGRLGGVLEELLKSGRESLSARGRKFLSPDEILASNKDNFSIGYDEVVSVSVVERGYLTSIMMLTASDKFEFYARLSLQNVVELLREGLGEKVRVGEFSR